MTPKDEIEECIEEIVGNIVSVMKDDEKEKIMCNVGKLYRDREEFFRRNGKKVKNGYTQEIDYVDGSRLFILNIPYQFPKGYFIVKEGEDSKAKYTVYASGTKEAQVANGNKEFASLIGKLVA